MIKWSSVMIVPPPFTSTSFWSVKPQRKLHPKHQHLENAATSVKRRRAAVGAKGEVGETIQVNEMGFINVRDTSSLVIWNRGIRLSAIVRGRRD
jgi:hypothetical protein